MQRLVLKDKGLGCAFAVQYASIATGLGALGVGIDAETCAVTSNAAAADADAGNPEADAPTTQPSHPTKPRAHSPGAGDIPSGEDIDMGNADTWPSPPGAKPHTVAEPSRAKPRNRGEESIYDNDNGEWRPHKPDNYHDKGHWNYKPGGNSAEWQDVF